MYFQVYNHKKREKQENKKYFNQKNTLIKKIYFYIFTLPRYCSRYIEVSTKSIDTVYRYGIPILFKQFHEWLRCEPSNHIHFDT